MSSAAARRSCLLALALLAALPARAADYAELHAGMTAAYAVRDFAAMAGWVRRALELRPDYPPMLYNLAVADAQSGRSGDALELLSRLAAMGLSFPAAEDADFSPLADEPRFARVLGAFATNARPAGRAETAFALDDGHFIPEGIAYDPERDVFLLGSVRTGRIARVKPSGAVSFWPAAAETAGLSAFGMAMEPDARHLVVAYNAVREHVSRSASPPELSAIAWLDAEGGGLRAFCALDDPEAVLGDVFVPAAGIAFAADGVGGAVYRVDRGSCRFTTVIAKGRLYSPQGMASSPDGAVLYVADYRGGLFALELESGRLRRLEPPANATLYGIDGLTRHGKWLIGVQNGLAPHRVIAVEIVDGTLREPRVLASALPEFDEPTQGVIARGRYYLVADSHWGRFDAEGALPPAEALSGPTVVAIPLP